MFLVLKTEWPTEALKSRYREECPRQCIKEDFALGVTALIHNTHMASKPPNFFYFTLIQ